MTALERFKEILDKRGHAYSVVYDFCGWHIELQLFGLRMIATNALPSNDPTHTRLVVHIMCPTPEQLMMMLDCMCGKTKEEL